MTTVSLAPAKPPARMLVNVDVFCFLVMIVNVVQRSEGSRGKGTTLMNIHIYTDLLISCYLLGWSWLPTNISEVDRTIKSTPHRGLRCGDGYGGGMWGSGCIHFLVETSIFWASNGSFPSHAYEDLGLEGLQGMPCRCTEASRDADLADRLDYAV